MLAILAVFGQTAHFDFVDYDDAPNVYENPAVEKGLSIKAAGWAFSHTQTGNWVPLTTLSHMLDCQLFGLRAGGHHLVNILWHAATTVLLFLLLRQMTGSLWRSAFIAAIFAIHPLRAESVAWVSERKDVLSAFFFVVTIGAYVRYVRQPSGAGYGVVILSFALGLLAKSMIVTLPFVLLLLDYWPLQRFQPPRQFLRLVREKIPFFVLSTASCAVAALAPDLIIRDARQLPLLARTGNALVSYAVYLRQMVFPAGLAIAYPNPPGGQPMAKVCLALVVIAALSALAVACRKKRPYLLVGWLWFVGMLVPVIGLIQISADVAHSDRYTYLPGIGLAIAGTWGATDLSSVWKLPRWVSAVLMMAAIGALALCGHIQTSYWKDSQSLWTRSLACTSGNFAAHVGLGGFFRVHGRLDEAIVQYREALEITPDDVETLNNLGNVLAMKGEDQAAIAQFHRALAIQPGFADTYVNLGNVLTHGRPDEAIALGRKALEIAPNNAKILNNLGKALAIKGADDAAIAQYQKALEIQPDYADVHFNLGNRLLKQGKLDEAAAHFRKAVEINPADADARNNLGRVLLLKGDGDGAMACFQQTTAMSPDPEAKWRSLGNGFLQQEYLQEAILCYRQAIKINPRSADACANLGMAFLKKGETNQAIDSWQQALAIAPNRLSVQNNLAWLLATASDTSLRNGAKAIALAIQADKLSGGGNPLILHTLAAAYAEQGSYGLAAATARRALALAVEQKMDALAAMLQTDIKLYEAKTPPSNPPR